MKLNFLSQLYLVCKTYFEEILKQTDFLHVIQQRGGVGVAMGQDEKKQWGSNAVV